jgi:hypothetical protein
VNIYQRFVLVVAVAVGLWGLSHALVPFEVTSPFGLTGGCSSPLASLSDDEPSIPESFLGDVDEDELQTCADVAGRKIVSALVIMVLAAVGGYIGWRLLVLDEEGRRDDEEAADRRETPVGDGAVPLGDELPPYAG